MISNAGWLLIIVALLLIAGFEESLGDISKYMNICMNAAVDKKKHYKED